jgi:tRNA(fMet)-specific endonuclease VapC
VSFLLDTNIVSALINEKTANVRSHLRRAHLAKETIGLPAIVLHELWFGVLRSARQFENAQRLRAFMAAGVQVVAFDEEDARRASEIRNHLALSGLSIGAYDLLIAAQGLRTDTILATANTSEFSRVQGLKLQNWLEDV